MDETVYGIYLLHGYLHPARDTFLLGQTAASSRVTLLHPKQELYKPSMDKRDDALY